MGKELLIAKDLKQYFPIGKDRFVRAVDGVNFSINEGEVMGLVGESGSGKSTIAYTVMGMYRQTDGEIIFNGQTITNKTKGRSKDFRRDAQIVFQDPGSSLNPYQDVRQILSLPLRVHNVVSKDGIDDKIREILQMVELPPDFMYKTPNSIGGGERQLVSIARALCSNPKFIILDEPTSSLTVQEVNKLFEMMRMLKEQGIALIYISHKMDEIFEICDQISVLRDGNLVMTKDSKDTNMGELITAMVGRSLESRFPPVDNIPGDPILSIQHLSTKYAPYLQDISFDVREGEIFGLYGLVGAGRTELLETIFGVRTRAAGRVYFRDHLMNFNNAHEAIEHGFALITEERKANGLFLKSDLTFNTTIANLDQYKGGLGLSMPKMVKATSKEIKVMHTKCMGPDDMITSLSGGNQQKVIFGKWLEREPQVFMMDEPTRGIDVGAKYEIYELIIKMAKQGKTVIVVSSEMPEILGITNRIGVMSNGHLSGIVNTKETNQEELLRLSAKYL